jgi:uncharacterized protein YggT (Ycf19 family)
VILYRASGARFCCEALCVYVYIYILYLIHNIYIYIYIYIYCVLDTRQAYSNTPGVLFAQLTAVYLVAVQLPALRVDDMGQTTGLVMKC